MTKIFSQCFIKNSMHPPFPGCELDADEFAVLAARYYGLPCPACAPHVGKIIRAKGSSANGKKRPVA